jgi:starch synthase
MSAIRILYVASEIEPFLKISDVADFIRKLPQAMHEKGMEIRILMPRFGVINERKNRLHEVVRLSGINIPVGNEEHPLIIKVASIPNAKLQVYFIDNEDYFKRKSVFYDKNDKWMEDNDERAVFFCKGVLETIKKLGWSPDIVHCYDWMTALVPLYLKTIYKEDPMFKDTKIVFSVYDNKFSEFFAEDVITKVMSSEIDEKEVSSLKDGYAGMIKLGAMQSDLILDATSDNVGFASMINGSVARLKTVSQTEVEIEEYFNIYTELMTK